jgi:hypothetical protein
MGELKRSSTLRIMAGKKEESQTDLIGVLIYRKRLPKGESFEEVRKSLLVKIEQVVKDSPYDYWVAPEPRKWLLWKC